MISGNHISSGERTTTFTDGDARSLLRNYLIFVREMRDERREPSIELRSEDVNVLATHLGVTEELVLGGLLDLMGATRAERRAMLAMLAAGAVTVVLSGSVVSGLSIDGVSVGFDRLAGAVHAAVVDAQTGGAVTSATDDRGSIASATPSADVLRSAATSRAGSPAVVVQRTTHPAAAPRAEEPAEIASAPGGSLVVSVATPPVPNTNLDTNPDDQTAIAQLPDGTTVGIATPPVPDTNPDTNPDDQTAIAQLPDGTTVGIAAPPVPPVTEG